MLDNTTITLVLKNIAEAFQHHAWYINGNGTKTPMMIIERYRGDNVSGVVLGNVSGGVWITDDIPKGVQPHGKAYWLPVLDPDILEMINASIQEHREEEQFGDATPPQPPVEEAAIAERKTVATPSR